MKTLALFALAFSVQGTVALKGHTREVSSLAISPDGKLLASGSVDRTVRLWDTTTKQTLASLEGHDGEVMSLAFSPDGKLLASGEMYKKIKIWDVATRKEVHMFSDINGRVTGLVFTPDGKRLFASTVDNSVLVWTVGSSAESKKLAHNYAVNGLAISPNGKTLATVGDDGSVHLWDVETLKNTLTLKHSDRGRSVAFSADGKTLVSGGGEVVKLWDVDTGAEKASAKAEANAVAFTPNGAMVVVGTQDNLTLFLNGSDLNVKSKVEKHERPVTSIAITPDGKSAFTGSMDMTIRIWAIPH